MNDAPADPNAADFGESGLRHALARGDRVLASVAPVLRHLLVHDDQTLFSDDILARMRGMLADLARQLAGALNHAAGKAAISPTDDPVLPMLLAALPEVPGLLGHLHALALESQMGERLNRRVGLDPVLSPLAQALIASPDPETAAWAMKALAAQARFVQAQRRMQLPLGELPGDLLHGVLAGLHASMAEHMPDPAASAAAGRAEADIRANYDEAASRLGLMAGLISGMGAGALAALSVLHAGLAMFATALAQAHGGAGGRTRDFVVLCLQEGQALRLALSLRAAGLKLPMIEENLLALHPGAAVPAGLRRLGAERAAALLNECRP